jgi:hypothetical protein
VIVVLTKSGRPSRETKEIVMGYYEDLFYLGSAEMLCGTYTATVDKVVGNEILLKDVQKESIMTEPLVLETIRKKDIPLDVKEKAVLEAKMIAESPDPERAYEYFDRPTIDGFCYWSTTPSGNMLWSRIFGADNYPIKPEVVEAIKEADVDWATKNTALIKARVYANDSSIPTRNDVACIMSFITWADTHEGHEWWEKLYNAPKIKKDSDEVETSPPPPRKLSVEAEGCIADVESRDIPLDKKAEAIDWITEADSDPDKRTKYNWRADKRDKTIYWTFTWIATPQGHEWWRGVNEAKVLPEPTPSKTVLSSTPKYTCSNCVDLQERIDELEEELEAAECDRDSFEEERDDFESERDEAQERVEELETDVSRLEDDVSIAEEERNDAISEKYAAEERAAELETEVAELQESLEEAEDTPRLGSWE